MIIALGHKQNVGKDEVAKILSDYGFTRVGFADRLYKVAKDLYGWDGFQDREYYLTNRDAKELPLTTVGKSPRQILIELGNKVRDIWEDTWVASCVQDNTVISDMRYPNEAKILRERGAFLIRVDRDVPQTTDVADTALDGFTDWDCVIKNDGSLEDLRHKVRAALNKVIHRRLLDKPIYQFGNVWTKNDFPLYSDHPAASRVDVVEKIFGL